MVNANALFLIAPEADIEGIIELASELDQPVDPNAEFEVFQLKHAIASQVIEMINSFYEERKGLGTKVMAVGDPRTNTLVVYASPRDRAEIAELISKVDAGSSAAVNQMRIYQLKNAVADEMAQVITEAILSSLNPASRTGGTGNNSGGNNFGGTGTGGASGQGSAQLREVKSTVLQFLSQEGMNLRSGLLTDIRVSADGRTNSLIISAPEESLPLLEEIIKQLDRPTNTVAEIKVFSLANSDAQSMVQLLEQMFSSQAQGNNNQNRSTLGIQVAGAEDVNSSLIPLKFTVDTRTNSVIAMGAAESLEVVEAVLLRLDTSDVRSRRTIVFRLKNSPAADVATAVNNFLSSRRELNQSSEGLVSAFEQIEREVIVVSEPVSNSLLISATARVFDEIREMVTRIDEAPAQVIIQALLVEVTLDNTDEFGVELGIQDSVLFRRSVVDQLVTLSNTTTAPNGVQTTTQNVISQTAIPGFLFNNQQLGNNTTVDPSRVGAQGLSNFSLGRTNGDLGYGGLVLAAGSEGVSVLLRALSASRQVEVLSRPQIRTLDNQTGMIQVGQNVPVVNGVNVNAVGSANPIVQQQSAGIILQVTPRISPDGRVVMVVGAERSEFRNDDTGVPIYTDVTTGRVIRSPRKDVSTAQATVAVASEQTIVLGGMISRNTINIQRKVPWLGDLPFLGIPFRYNFSNNVKRELLIFLTPRVIRTDADSEYIKQVEVERIHFMESEAEEMHGPILSAPPPAAASGPVIHSVTPDPNASGTPGPNSGQPTFPGLRVPPPAPPAPDDTTPMPMSGPNPLPRELEMSPAVYEEPAARKGRVSLTPKRLVSQAK